MQVPLPPALTQGTSRGLCGARTSPASDVFRQASLSVSMLSVKCRMQSFSFRGVREGGGRMQHNHINQPKIPPSFIQPRQKHTHTQQSPRTEAKVCWSVKHFMVKGHLRPDEAASSWILMLSLQTDLNLI